MEGRCQRKLDDKYDVVIVGAGPAGCMVAYHLPRDFRVLLVERDKLPRHKTCGGMLNPISWEFVRGLGMPADLVDNEDEIEFRFVDINSDTTRETGLYFRNVSRDDFDAWLLSLLPPNVHVVSQTRLASLETNGHGVLVKLASRQGERQLKTRWLVGAGGALSRIREFITGEKPSRYIVVQDTIEPGRKLPPYFDCIAMPDTGDGLAYVYTAPKGEQALVGSVFYPGSTDVTRQHGSVRTYLENHGVSGHLVKRDGAFAIQVRNRNDIILGKGSLMLVGEAAGLISPTSGEGISYALRSGTYCAQAISGSADPLETYEQLALPLISEILYKIRRLPLLETKMGRYFLGALPKPALSRLTAKL